MRFRPVQWFDSLPSTNDYLRNAVERGVKPSVSGVVVAARRQTGGRGREQRPWIMRSGRDLAFSFHMAARIDPIGAPSAAMATALGVCEALERFGVNARVKWPNDVRTPDGRKICGILAQSLSRNSPEFVRLVIGVGINVNSGEADLADVGQPAASVLTETGREYALEAVLEEVLGVLAPRLTAWEEGGFAGLRRDWLQRCDDIGRVRPAPAASGSVDARIEDFGAHGELLLRGPGDERYTAYLPESP